MVTNGAVRRAKPQIWWHKPELVFQAHRLETPVQRSTNLMLWMPGFSWLPMTRGVYITSRTVADSLWRCGESCVVIVRYSCNSRVRVTSLYYTVVFTSSLFATGRPRMPITLTGMCSITSWTVADSLQRRGASCRSPSDTAVTAEWRVTSLYYAFIRMCTTTTVVFTSSLFATRRPRMPITLDWNVLHHFQFHLIY